MSGDDQNVGGGEQTLAPEATPAADSVLAGSAPAGSVSAADAVSGSVAVTNAPAAVEASKKNSGPSPEEIERLRIEFQDKLQWYVVHAYSGFEFKAKTALEERARMHNMSHLFGEIHVPQETVVELIRGQKKTSNRKFFPGYILVQMVLNQDTWHLVKETPKISGFVGDATDPVPLSEEEVKRIKSQVEEGASSPKSKSNFEQGETVKVIDGPFTDFNGTVEEVRPDKGKVKVLISIFGRATPVELDFIQVEKT